MRRAIFCFGMLCFFCCPGFAADLDASTSLNAGTNPIPLAGDTQNVTNNPSGLYDFGDKNGDGTRNDPVSPAGMNMQGYQLSTDDGTDIRLHMNDGDITYSGGAVTSFRTGHGTPFTDAGDITVTNVGDITLGSINTEQTSRGGHGGTVTIGQGSERAGTVVIRNITTRTSGGVGDVWHPGDVTIYGSADVTVEDDIHALNYQTAYTAAGSKYGGHVVVDHDGAFTVRDILTWGNGNKSSGSELTGGGDVTLEGNALDGLGGDNERDACMIRDIDTSFKRSEIGTYAGDVNISGYARVTISNLWTYNEFTGAAAHQHGVAGNVTIEDITQDIAITGSINLESKDEANHPQHDGSLTLKCGGTITLASLDVDPVKMDSATFSVTLDGTVEKKDWMWVWIQSEPDGLTINGSEVSGFTAVDSHIYYTDDGGSLSGNYDIMISAVDSGWNMIELTAGQMPPGPPAAGTVIWLK